MNIHEALVKVMDEVGFVGKNKKADKYSYRGIEDIYQAVQPAMIKHGVFNAVDVQERKEREFKTASGSLWVNVTIKVKYTFWATDGSSVDVIVYGEGSDNGDKGTNKAMSQAHKYALSQLFCIPYEAGEAKEVQEAIAPDITKEQHKEKSMEETVKAFPQALKDQLKAAGYTGIAGAFKAYQGVHGDLDALAQLCVEKIKKK